MGPFDLAEWFSKIRSATNPNETSVSAKVSASRKPEEDPAFTRSDSAEGSMPPYIPDGPSHDRRELS
jgi:hypothetical protein